LQSGISTQGGAHVDLTHCKLSWPLAFAVFCTPMLMACWHGLLVFDCNDFTDWASASLANLIAWRTILSICGGIHFLTCTVPYAAVV